MRRCGSLRKHDKIQMHENVTQFPVDRQFAFKSKSRRKWFAKARVNPGYSTLSFEPQGESLLLKSFDSVSCQVGNKISFTPQGENKVSTGRQVVVETTCFPRGKRNESFVKISINKLTIYEY